MFLLFFSLAIGTAVAEINDPEAVESITNWTNATALSNSNSANAPNGAQRPVVAVAPNGDVIVVFLWQRSSDVLDTDPYYRKSTDNGLTWSTRARIYTSAAYSRQVQVAFDNNSKAHAVWTEGNNQVWYGNQDVWASNGSKMLFSGNILVESPKIAVDKNNVLHLVWTAVNFDGENVFYSRSTNGGASWTSPVNVSNNAGSSFGSSESPALVIDSHNQPNVAWEEQVGGSEYKINFSRRASNGTWSAPTSISTVVPGITSAREPDITIVNNQIVVVFENRIGIGEQTLYLLECVTNCTAVPANNTNWKYRPATAQAFGAKDSDPTFLGPKVVSLQGCKLVILSGIAGSTSSNNEKVRIGNSCNNFSSNPTIQAIDNSLGINDRAIKPSASVGDNWFIYVAYERKGQTRSDIYIVRNMPAIYLPMILK